MSRRSVYGLVMATMLVSGNAQAQKAFSLWLGAGRPTSDSGAVSFKTSNVYAGLQLDAPLMPVAFRVDGMVGGADIRHGAKSYSASLVVPLRAPAVQPYGILGYGVYNHDKPTEVKGYSYGAGLRVGLSGVGFFGEVRRHEKLNRTMATLGITL